MPKRIRSVKMEVYLTPAEKQQIQERMAQAGIRNFSAYARQMLTSGQVVKKDYTELKALTSALGKIGTNVNQIAKRANERRVVPPADIDKILDMLHRIYMLLNREMGRILRS